MLRYQQHIHGLLTVLGGGVDRENTNTVSHGEGNTEEYKRLYIEMHCSAVVSVPPCEIIEGNTCGLGLKRISLEDYLFVVWRVKSYYNENITLPYFWMPKWSNTCDPSARTLTILNV